MISRFEVTTMLFNVLSFSARNLSVLLLMLFGFFSPLPQGTDRSPFAGKWEGKMNDQPGIEITIKNAGAETSGVIVFYFQERGADGKWHVKDKYEAPLLSVQVTGKGLTFEVAHHKTHESLEFGPNVKFRMELGGGDGAVLYRVGDPRDPGMKLTRLKEDTPNSPSI
jgi:hypothetical protein